MKILFTHLKRGKRHIACLFLAAIMIPCMISCNKQLDISSSHVASEALQWQDITDTRSALFGIYGLLRAALAENEGYWIYGELRLGDFTAYDRTDLESVIQNNLSGAFPLVEQLSDWRRFYAVINAASVFIEHAPEVVANDPLYSANNLKLDMAQARALRAFTYFYMVRIWGDVPLITQAYDNGTFPTMKRTPWRQVLGYAHKELLAAAEDLPYVYGKGDQEYYDNNSFDWNGVLFTKISAYAVLAHIAAWQSKYLNTEVYTNFIMEHYDEASISYSDVDELTDGATGLFAERNPSQIIAFNFMDDLGESTTNGHIENLTLASPFINRRYPEIYVSKDSIAKVFTDLDDQRFGFDTATKTYRTRYFTNYGSSIPLFSKINVVRTGDYPLFGSAIVFTRLEEIVLLRAEALAVLNRRNEAIAELNIIRSARGLPVFTSITNKDIMDAIFEERRRELMGEGWHWYDQIRYNRLRKLNPDFQQLIKTGGIYWPVSQSVLKANPLIDQNIFWR